MITAESIVAKVVTFIVEKALGRLAGLTLDKRKKACRSLTKLYYCVQALDDVTDKIKGTFQFFELRDSKSSAMIHALNNHRHDLALATNMFIDLGQELHAGLEIIDPALAECCHLLYVGKGDLLSLMSNCVEWDRSADKPTIVIKRPSGRLDLVDMESMYQETERAIERGERHYWPESAFDEYYSDFGDFAIKAEDEEAAREVRDMVERQSSLLKQARDRLRELLRTSFNIEELLFQSDSRPYR